MKESNIKEAFDFFKPENCVFVSSVDKNNNPSWMVAAWNMKCSLKPPLFAVTLSKKWNTHKLIQKSKEFVISVPNKELEEALLFFGSTNWNEINKFQETKIETEKSKFIKTPLIKKATINFECELFKEVDIWKGIIFIWKILTLVFFNEVM